MGPMASRLGRLLALGAAILVTPAPRAAAQSQETEPNNSVATANSTALGIFMSGFINIPGDTDYYFIDLVGGTDVAFRVDAARYGATFFNSVMGLLSTDGHTVLVINDDGNDDYVTDSRIWYHVPASGRYYVFVTSA